MMRQLVCDVGQGVGCGFGPSSLPDRVLFDYDRHELHADAGPILNDLAEVITYFVAARVQVNGHTDSRGLDDYNQRLSERRARSVVDHMLGAGVEPERLTARGFGEARPVAPNARPDGSDDPDGRAQKRRVEIVIEGVDASNLPR